MKNPEFCQRYIVVGSKSWNRQTRSRGRSRSCLDSSRTSRDPKRDREQRESELSALARAAHQASEILGATSLTLHDFPDNRMDSCDLLDIIKVIEGAIAQHQPNIIYTHHIGDLNIDHRCTCKAVVTAARPLPNSCIKITLL